MSERDDTVKREQVARQYDAVVGMAKALMEVHEDMARIFRVGACPEILQMSGERSARFMEILGDMLNGMDAVTKEDAWVKPIFHEAHRMFPQPKHTCAHCGGVPQPRIISAPPKEKPPA